MAYWNGTAYVEAPNPNTAFYCIYVSFPCNHHESPSNFPCRIYLTTNNNFGQMLYTVSIIGTVVLDLRDVEGTQHRGDEDEEQGFEGGSADHE